MSISIKSGSSTDLLEVSSGNTLNINFADANTFQDNGYFVCVSEVDDGVVLGEETYRKNNASMDFRMHSGIDKIIWYDKFSHSTLNTSRYKCSAVTQTIVISGSNLVLNANNSVTSGAFSVVSTYKHFYPIGSFPSYFDVSLTFSENPHVDNHVIEFGLGLASGTTVVKDGIYFKTSPTGLLGVINSGGTEITGATNFVPTAYTYNHYLIVSNDDNDTTEFWIDNILRLVLTSGSGNTSSSQSCSFPIFFRNYNTGAVSTPVQLKINEFGFTFGDVIRERFWNFNSVSNGLSNINQPDGQPPGSTINSTNSTFPTSASSLSNSTSLYSLMGGQFVFSGQTSGETDYVIFAYQNPEATSTNPGKILIITGIRVDVCNFGNTMGATTSTVLQWGIGVGSTGVDLATVDDATTGTRGPRKLALGCIGFPGGSVVGAVSDRIIDTTFLSPLFIEQGCYMHVFVKIPVAPTPASGQYFRGSVYVSGYFE